MNLVAVPADDRHRKIITTRQQCGYFRYITFCPTPLNAFRCDGLVGMPEISNNRTHWQCVTELGGIIHPTD